ncbi:hypothetical protein lerEdw1_003060 [Lerista edwardsae]|nr:hypothetical protein lerEdw1_003060 [Lerista edwardsae]
MVVEMELKRDQLEAEGLKPAVKSPSKTSLKNALMSIIKSDSEKAPRGFDNHGRGEVVECNLVSGQVPPLGVPPEIEARISSSPGAVMLLLITAVAPVGSLITK